MKIFVYRPSGNLGPFSEFDLRSMVQGGLVKPDELGWQEGMAEWRPLSSFVPLFAPPPPPAGGKPSGPPPVALSGDEMTRRKFLRAEANVRSLGLLYYLGSVIWVALAAALFYKMSRQAHATAAEHFLPFVLIAVAVLYFWLASRMRVLDPVGVIPATILACLGMLNFPVGTIINGVILFILHSSKGHKVFTPEYHEVVIRTPQIVCKISLFVKIILVLLALALCAGVGLLALSRVDLR